MISRSLPCSLAVLVLPSILAFLSGCRSANSYLEKGNDEFAQGQFDAATLNYRKAVQKDPSFGEAYYRAGLSELKQNRAAEALQDFQQAVRLMPDNQADTQAARTDLTNLLLGAYVGDSKRPKFLYDLLVKFSRDWLAKNPNSMQGLRIAGYLAMLEQRPDEAVSDFRRAHALYPHEEKIADGLMDALFRANQPAEAEKVGLDFVGANKGAADVYDALYRMYLAAHRAEDAENILKRKAQSNPRENSYLLQLAAFYAGVHRKPDMETTLQTFLSNPGGDTQVHMEAGDFYTSVGDLAAALQQYRAGSSANQKDKLAYQNRIARVLLLQKNQKEGLQEQYISGGFVMLYLTGSVGVAGLCEPAPAPAGTVPVHLRQGVAKTCHGLYPCRHHVHQRRSDPGRRGRPAFRRNRFVRHGPVPRPRGIPDDVQGQVDIEQGQVQCDEIHVSALSRYPAEMVAEMAGTLGSGQRAAPAAQADAGELVTRCERPRFDAGLVGNHCKA